MSKIVNDKDPLQEDALKQLAEHLAFEVNRNERRGSFDMDDAPESDVLSAVPQIKEPLDWLEKSLGQKWREADRAALSYQNFHHWFARIAITTGVAAIVLAIVQLAIKQTFSALAGVAPALEALAVIPAVIAVAVGLAAKFDRRWLAQRHLAERLRMIKFRSLERLCVADTANRSEWERWIEEQVRSLDGIADPNAIKRKVAKWSTEDTIEPSLASSAEREPDPGLLLAVTVYYRFKRVEYQANYFHRRRMDFEEKSHRWRELSLPLFLVSVGCVIAHFAFEYLHNHTHDAVAELVWEALAIWFVALAAIIPVLGLGIRAWFAAFEMPRSAVLFAAKHRALRHVIDLLTRDSGKALPTLRHFVQTEHFLEHEHREWLRLVSDTEWFL